MIVFQDKIMGGDVIYFIEGGKINHNVERLGKGQYKKYIFVLFSPSTSFLYSRNRSYSGEY
jgi:hypothetical protein